MTLWRKRQIPHPPFLNPAQICLAVLMPRIYEDLGLLFIDQKLLFVFRAHTLPHTRTPKHTHPHTHTQTHTPHTHHHPFVPSSKAHFGVQCPRYTRTTNPGRPHGREDEIKNPRFGHKGQNTSLSPLPSTAQGGGVTSPWGGGWGVTS